LKEIVSLVTNFSDQKLLVTTVNNLKTNLKNKNYWLFISSMWNFQHTP